MLTAFKVLRTLLGYVLIGLPALLVFGWLLPFIDVKQKNYAFNIWYAIDVAVCAIAHNTYKRSISGWTGQHMHTKPRYKYQAMIIDFLLKKVDGPDHCWRVYTQELSRGYVKG